MTAAYKKDLSFIHHHGFSDFAKNAGAGILDLFRQFSISEGFVVDLGCGSGTWARMLVDAGYDVYGVDISEAMIELCRTHVPEARFACDSLFDVQIPACSAITCIGECLNYLFDENNGLQALERLFARIYDSLDADGFFIFDVITPGYGSISGPPKRHFVTPEWAVLVEVEENASQHLLTRSITSFRKMGAHYVRDEEVHRIRLYDGQTMKHLLESAGFQVQLSNGYPDYPLSDAHAVCVARKAQ